MWWLRSTLRRVSILDLDRSTQRKREKYCENRNRKAYLSKREKMVFGREG